MSRLTRSLLEKIKKNPSKYFPFKKKDGVWGYRYYPGDERIDQIPLRSRRYLILPKPENQGVEKTCMIHATINAFEARLRLARLKVDPRRKTPRLSIQHGIDACPSSDYILDFLGVNVRVGDEEAVFGEDERGVTIASHYQYRGPKGPNEYRQGWERHRLNDAIIGIITYDGKSENCINYLIICLRKDGPFVAWFDIRSSHEERSLHTKRGEIQTHPDGTACTHAVTITGYKKWRSTRTGKMKGFWEFMDNYGMGWGKSGFGRVAFDAVKGMCIPIVN